MNLTSLVATMTLRGGGGCGGMRLFAVCSEQNFVSRCHRRPQSTPGDNARLACAARGTE